jgi:predicted amidohydrolase
MNGREPMVAAIQMSFTPNKDENLATAEQLIHAAASAGADLVALPEMWNCHALESAYRENAERMTGKTTPHL